MMRLTIIGFGNQAKAWSHNLKDSGFPIRVALKPASPSLEVAVREGFEVVEIGSEDFYADRAFALLSPDSTHNQFLTTYGHLIQEGSLILYAHGFSLLENKFDARFPHLQHVLFAPKSIGTELRNQYLMGGDLGAVVSLEHVKDTSEVISQWVAELARALGITMGPYVTTFERETQADLYSEQGLLCSLIPYAASEMFSHLVEEGIEPELAYFECWHELKLIITAMVDRGPEGFFDLISPNALVGSEKGYHKLITPDFKQNLRSLFKEIRSGKFNQELEQTNVEDLRKEIRTRWRGTPLMETFTAITQDRK